MIAVIIAAAGRGRRMAQAKNKIFHELNGKAILQYSLELFSRIDIVSELIVVASIEEVFAVEKIIQSSGCAAKVVVGGQERQDSIMNALVTIGDSVKYVLVHDGARPFVDEASVLRLIDCMIEFNAAILAVPVKDTIKVVDANSLIVSTPERSALFAAQTPQGFARELLVNSYDNAHLNNYRGTDDASIVEYFGKTVCVVPGSYDNIKITTPEDITIGCELLRNRNRGSRDMSVSRVGFGYDVHQLVQGRDLVLGGLKINYKLGLLGHSDADVLLHAIMDALLGAAALGDIGKHFPDTDIKFKGASSIVLLQQVNELIKICGYSINNIDATVAAQKPKLAPFISAMRENIARICQIEVDAVNIKATTTERLGFIGREEGISA